MRSLLVVGLEASVTYQEAQEAQEWIRARFPALDVLVVGQCMSLAAHELAEHRAQDGP